MTRTLPSGLPLAVDRVVMLDGSWPARIDSEDEENFYLVVIGMPGLWAIPKDNPNNRIKDLNPCPLNL